MGKVRFDGLVKAVMDEMETMVEEIDEGVKKAVKTVAKGCRKRIKSGSPKRTGEYKKGWRTTTNYDGPGGIRVTVHNKDHYQLTHLLENGHALRGGGRVEGIPHVKPAEEWAAKELQKEVEAVIKK